MFIRELFESNENTAIVAFGRLNPPTIGHEKLVNTIKSFAGDHYLFLSHSRDPKNNPLSFHDKMMFAQELFSDINIGHEQVTTPINMMKHLENLGYTNVIYVAGSDRVDQFNNLLNTYNGKEYNFNTIKVISAGERDPDADGAEGMSASKMRAAVVADNFEEFKKGVPNPAVAQEMFAAVKDGMSQLKPKKVTKKKEEPMTQEGYRYAPQRIKTPKPEKTIKDNEKVKNLNVGDVVFCRQPNNHQYISGKIKRFGRTMIHVIHKDGSIVAYRPDDIGITTEDAAGVGIVNKQNSTKDVGPGTLRKNLKVFKLTDAAYKGNIGLMELFKFFAKAEKSHPQLVKKVKELIKNKQDKEVWDIVQQFTGTKLIGPEFEKNIAEELMKAYHGRA